MFDRIENIPSFLIAGLRRKIRLTPELITTQWRDFMPLVKDIPHRKNEDLYSIQVYDEETTFENFNPEISIIKWAAVAVNFEADLSSPLEYHNISGGLYAVFIHRGLPSEFPKTMQFIFQNWLPESGYEYDNREQFEIMGKKYLHLHPDSEEEVWIPVKKL